MAVGTGISLDVSKLDKELDRLDKKLDALIKKGEKTEKAFETMFKGASAKNLLDHLDKVQGKIVDLSKIKDPMKWDSKSLMGYIDKVNQLLRTIEKANTAQGGTPTKIIDTEALATAKKDFQAILREVKSLEKAQSQRATSRNQTYAGAMRYSANAKSLEQERQAIVNLEAARDRLKKTDADYAVKLNALNEAIKRHEKTLKDATKTDKDRADEAAKNAKRQLDEERRLYEERARLRREENKKKNQTYEGAMAFSASAKTLNREIKAVKNLEAARAKLSRTDQDYHQKLNAINKRIAEHNRNIERATAATREHNKALAAIGRGIASAFSVQAIRGYVNKMIQVRGEMELQQRSLQAILQNKDEANEIWQKTIDLAVRSPFRIKDLVTYTKQLAAYRVENDKIFDTTKMLADVSAGLGVDMNRLILAFGQVKAANFLRGTELRQFTEAGIPMLDELAKHFNEMNDTALTSADIFDMISKRMVLFEDVEAVFERMTQAGGTFYRMQEIQSETLRGQISNLKDSLDIMFNEIGKANDGSLKLGVKAVKSLVDNYEKIIPILKISVALFAIYKTNALLAARSITTMKGAWDAFAVSWGNFSKTLTLNPWMLWLSAIVAVGAAIYKVWKQFDDVNKAYNDMLNQQSQISAKVIKSLDSENYDEARKSLQDLINLANEEYDLKINVDVKGLENFDDIRSRFDTIRQQMIDANAFAAEFQKELIEANLKTKWNFADWNMVGIFEQGMNKDIDQMGDSYDNLNRVMVNKLSATIEALDKKWKELSQEQKDAYWDLSEDIRSDEDLVDYFDRIRESYKLLLESNAIEDRKLTRQLSRYSRRMDEAKEEFDVFINGIDETVMSKTDKEKTLFLNAAIDDAKAEKNWSEFEETQIRKWLEKKYEIELTPKITTDPDSLKAWQASYNELFVGKTGFRAINSIGTSQKQVIEQLNAQYESTAELLERIQLAGEDSVLAGGAYEGENLEKLKKDLADIREQLDWFGAEEKKDKNKESASIKILQKRINLLKEVNKKYLELEKTFDAVTAKEKVMEAYSDTFREAFEGTGVDLDLYKVMTNTIVDASEVGKEAGSALTEGMLEKLKALEESGTYIRSFSEDLIERIKKSEGFRAKAYQDAGGVWTQGYGETQGIEKDKEWTKEFAAQRLQTRLTEDYAAAVNKVLDANKDLIVTQEQYNALVDLAYQGGGGAVKNLVNYAKNIEQGSSYIERISRKIKETMSEEAAARFGETFVNSFKEAATIQERMALLLQTMNLTIKGEINKDWYAGMQKRSDERASMFSGDLDIANQLETVLVRIAGMDFTTTEGMVEALGKLKEIAEKEGPEAKNILSQAISGLEAEIGLRIKKESEEMLLEQVQEFFDEYDLSVELKKLDIPPKLAKTLFGVDTLDLSNLRKNVIAQFAGSSEEIKAELNKGVLGADWGKVHNLGLGTELIEEVKKALEKIDDLEDKQQKERFKKYVEYAKKTLSERAKIKMDELRMLKEIEETFATKAGDSEETIAYKNDMKARAKAKAKQEAEVAMRELDWKDFQKTDTFTSLFDDIGNASDALVSHMISRLREFKEEWKDMPLEDVRVIVDKLNELEVALAERSPWEAYRNAKEAVKKAREEAVFSFESEEARNIYGKGKSNKDYIAALQIENAYQEEKASNAEKEMAVIEEILALKAKEREGSVVDLGLTRQQMEYTKMTEDELRDLLKTKKGEANTARAIVTDNGLVLVQYKNQEKSLLKQKETLGEVQNMANDVYDAFKELAEALGEDEDSPSAIFADMGMNMMNAVLNTIMLQAQLKAVEVGAYAAGTAINTAMGVIGWIVMGVQLLVAGIKAIAQINDNRIVASLEEQAATIEKQRDLYEQIEKKVEKAYNVDQLRQYNNEMKRNIDLEIQALQASIALERSRKNADEDQIADWQKEIEEARERLAESTQDMMEELGGVFDLTDFTSSFVDAWWDAMDEGKSGLDALGQHFEDTMKDMVKKQALYQGANAIMKQVQDAINKSLEGDYSINQGEWDTILAAAKKANVDLDAFLQGYRDLFGTISDSAGGSLSELQKGIQGVTEDTAQIIEAYLNSIRGYVSEQVTYTKRLYEMFDRMSRGTTYGLNVRMIS
jgi:GH24 family phage-related lysozyme (muramidase)